jgi:molecular chaperone DnaJ
MVPTGLNQAAKDALSKFDEETGSSLKSVNTAGATTATDEKKKKKGFMDKIKETIDDM